MNATLASLGSIHERIAVMAKSIANIGGHLRQQEETGQTVASKVARVSEGLRAVVARFRLESHRA